MSVSEATKKALKELGLTEYELQAYIALVSGGEMSASEVSSASDVPYSRVYDVLNRLEDKGFIQVRGGRPTMYVAKAPTEVVRLVQLEWERRLERHSERVVEELQPRFEKDTQATTRDVWVLHGRAAILAKAMEMLEQARDEVKLSLPELDLSLENLDAIVERVLELKAKRVRILTANVDEAIEPSIPRDFEVRTRDRVFGAGLVVDSDQTLIIIVGGEDETSLVGVYSSHAVFAAIANAYFDSLWQESTAPT
ncbi:MAG: TrmB family transcriptional regulator [Promethearchaeia archaeon]